MSAAVEVPKNTDLRRLDETVGRLREGAKAWLVHSENGAKADDVVCVTPTWEENFALSMRLDFSRYDVLLRASENHSLDQLFAAVAKNECSEVAEKAGTLTIEIIEKEALGT